MGSPYNNEYANQNREPTPSFMRGQVDIPQSQVVISYYEANLSREGLREIRTRLSNLGQVQPHETRPNIFVVTMNFDDSANASQILQVFQSQDANAKQAPSI